MIDVWSSRSVAALQRSGSGGQGNQGSLGQP
jgi:hypothetical protein